MHQATRQTAVTYRDGEAPRVVGTFRDEAKTRVLPVPRGKWYTIELDLDAVASAGAEPSAPCAVLDL